MAVSRIAPKTWCRRAHHGYEPPETTIVSYPRSGLNWIRYCIEYFSNRPTPGPIALDKGHNFIIGRQHDVSESHDPRVLYTRPFRNASGKPDYKNMVLLLRNYKESHVREGRLHVAHHKGLNRYVRNLKAYHEFSGRKLLIYYEDLILNFDVMEKILSFIGIEYDLSNFDLEHHRNASLTIYSMSNSRYCKRKAHILAPPLNDAEKHYLDEHMKENLPRIYDQYLGQYCEDSLLPT